MLIARALAQETEMIILDEPTNHLDIGSQIKTLSLLKNSGKTVLTALYDPSHSGAFLRPGLCAEGWKKSL